MSSGDRTQGEQGAERATPAATPAAAPASDPAGPAFAPGGGGSAYVDWLGRAPVGQRAAIVSRMQTGVGNAATTAMLQRNHLLRAPPTVTLGRVGFTQTVQRGGEGSGLPREPQKFYKGDTLTISAFAMGGAPVSEWSRSLNLAAPEHFDITERDDGKNYFWELRAKNVGYHTGFAKIGFGSETESLALNFTVIADLADFQQACTEALAKLGERYDGAVGALNKGASAYDVAFKKQEAALKDVSATEKMIEDLAWGALFAAVGGGAGGAVGSLLKGTLAKGAADTAAGGAFIDAGKDLMKFSTRSLVKLRGGSGPATSGDSTAQPGDPAAHGGGGDRKATGDDPFQWLTGFAGDLLKEKAKLSGKIGEVISAARQARDANTKADLDEDPVALISSDTQLVALANDLPSDYKKYLAKLWHTWLENFAWKVEEHTTSNPNMERDDVTTYTVEDNIGRKIRKKLEEAAAECGESADAWIATYAPKAKEKAEADRLKKY